MTRRDRDQEHPMSLFNTIANVIIAAVPLAAVLTAVAVTAGGAA